MKQQVYSAFDISLRCGICDRTIHTSVDEYIKSTRIRSQIKEGFESDLAKLKGFKTKKNSIGWNTNYNQMREDLRDKIEKCHSVNFHYDCATEHDELMTADEFSDMGDYYD